ncbi:MAG: alkaline phosphatase family protein [Nitrospira sp.]|nr:alkaline phosphatase family protein [Nitrospira sp.]
MTRFRLLFFFILICLAGIPCRAFSASPPVEHIFIVVLENTNAEDAYTQPFMRTIANQGAYLGNFHGVTHPSQPNYFALTSGSTWNVDNKMITIDGSHIGDLLEAKGKSWKVYAENYPGNCFLKEKRGAYARRHVPFLSYKNIQSNPARCARVVNSSELQADVKNNTLPDFSLYIPDNKK